MKQVVLHFRHCRSSSGNSSNVTLSESVTPCKSDTSKPSEEVTVIKKRLLKAKISEGKFIKRIMEFRYKIFNPGRWKSRLMKKISFSDQ